MKLKKLLCICLLVIITSAAAVLLTACGGHEHDWQWEIKKEATCTELGLEVRTCSCGEKEERKIPKKPHAGALNKDDPNFHFCLTCRTYVTGRHNMQEQSSIAPTCTSDGSVTKVCTACGYTVTEVFPKSNHEYVKTREVEATCTTPGYITYTCRICSQVYTENTPALGHDLARHYDLCYTKDGRAILCYEKDGFYYLNNDFNENSKIVSYIETLHCQLCDRCGEAVVGTHSEVVPTTYKEDLYTYHECDVCNKKFDVHHHESVSASDIIDKGDGHHEIVLNDGSRIILDGFGFAEVDGKLWFFDAAIGLDGVHFQICKDSECPLSGEEDKNYFNIHDHAAGVVGDHDHVSTVGDKEYYYDDEKHWEACSICSKHSYEESHSFEIEGGSYKWYLCYLDEDETYKLCFVADDGQLYKDAEFTQQIDLDVVTKHGHLCKICHAVVDAHEHVAAGEPRYDETNGYFYYTCDECGLDYGFVHESLEMEGESPVYGKLIEGAGGNYISPEIDLFSSHHCNYILGGNGKPVLISAHTHGDDDRPEYVYINGIGGGHVYTCNVCGVQYAELLDGDFAKGFAHKPEMDGDEIIFYPCVINGLDEFGLPHYELASNFEGLGHCKKCADCGEYFGYAEHEESFVYYEDEFMSKRINNPIEGYRMYNSARYERLSDGLARGAVRIENGKYYYRDSADQVIVEMCYEKTIILDSVELVPAFAAKHCGDDAYHYSYCKECDAKYAKTEHQAEGYTIIDDNGQDVFMPYSYRIDDEYHGNRCEICGMYINRERHTFADTHQVYDEESGKYIITRQCSKCGYNETYTSTEQLHYHSGDAQGKYVFMSSAIAMEVVADSVWKDIFRVDGNQETMVDIVFNPDVFISLHENNNGLHFAHYLSSASYYMWSYDIDLFNEINMAINPAAQLVGNDYDEFVQNDYITQYILDNVDKLFRVQENGKVYYSYTITPDGKEYKFLINANEFCSLYCNQNHTCNVVVDTKNHTHEYEEKTYRPIGDNFHEVTCGCCGFSWIERCTESENYRHFASSEAPNSYIRNGYGQHWHYCTLCDGVYGEKEDCVYGEVPVDIENPTCDRDGHKTFACEICNGDETKYDIVIPRFGHVEDRQVVVFSNSNDRSDKQYVVAFEKIKGFDYYVITNITCYGTDNSIEAYLSNDDKVGRAVILNMLTISGISASGGENIFTPTSTYLTLNSTELGTEKTYYFNIENGSQIERQLVVLIKDNQVEAITDYRYDAIEEGLIENGHIGEILPCSEVAYPENLVESDLTEIYDMINAHIIDWKTSKIDEIKYAISMKKLNLDEFNKVVVENDTFYFFNEQNDQYVVKYIDPTEKSNQQFAISYYRYREELNDYELIAQIAGGAAPKQDVDALEMQLASGDLALEKLCAQVNSSFVDFALTQHGEETIFSILDADFLFGYKFMQILENQQHFKDVEATRHVIWCSNCNREIESVLAGEHEIDEYGICLVCGYVEPLTIIDGVVTACNTEAKIVRIPAARGGQVITGIADGAFDGCNKLETIIISGNNLEQIGNRAFNACPNLKEIILKDENTYFETDGRALYTFGFGELVVYFGGNAGTEYAIHKDTIKVRSHAFAGAVNLEILELGRVLYLGTKVIDETAFARYSSPSFDLTDTGNVYCIRYSSDIEPVIAGFKYDCGGTADKHAISRLNHIYDESGHCVYCDKEFEFRFTRNGDELVIDGYDGEETDITIYTKYAFGTSYKDYTQCTVVEIGDGAFKDKEITSMNCIDESGAFSNRLPITVKRVGNNAFAGCENLTLLTLPASIEEIGYNAFKASGIENLHFDGINENLAVGTNAFEECIIQAVFVKNLIKFINIDFANSLANPLSCNAKLYVGNNAPTEISITGVDEIKQYALFGAKGITKIVLGESIRDIDMGAFANIASLHEVVFNCDVDELVVSKVGDLDICTTFAGSASGQDGLVVSGNIPANAFLGNSVITKLTIADNTTKIGHHAFADMTGLEEINYNVLTEILTTPKSGYPNVENDLSTVFASSGQNAGFVLRFGGDVKIVPANMFSGNIKLKEITFGGSETEICENAFTNCSSLESIKTNESENGTLPASLVKIAANAFKGCEDLVVITLGENLKDIGDYAFSGSGITSINIPASVEKIGDGAFTCDGLATLTFASGDADLEIGDMAFQGTILTSVILPDRTTSVGALAFNYCEKATTLVIGRNVKTIKESAFANMYKLAIFNYNVETETLNEGTERENNLYGVFAGSGDIGFTLIVGDDVVTIPDNMFRWSQGDLEFGNLKLSSVTLGESITKIGEYAFAGCTTLATLKTTSSENGVLPLGLLEIGRFAFSKCSKLETLTLGESITKIGESAFEGMTKLQEINYNIATDALNEHSTENELVDVFAGSGCSGLALYVGENVKLLPKNILNGNVNLSKVIFADEDNLTHIYNQAFLGCSGLEEIKVAGGENGKLPESLQEIKEYAFSGCTAISTITIGENVSVISEGVFSGCLGLETVVLHDGITSVSDKAFRGCLNLETIQTLGGENGALPLGLISIGESAFEQTAIQKLTLGENIAEIGGYAFANITALNNIVFNLTVEEFDTIQTESGSTICTIFSGSAATENGLIVSGNIPANAFLGNIAIKKLDIQGETTTIGADAFNGCLGVKTLTIGGGVSEIGEHAFAGMINISEINYNVEAETINAGSARANDLLDVFSGAGESAGFALNVGNNVKVIPANIFSGNTCLVEICFESESVVEEIGGYAFNNCINLATITMPDSVMNGILPESLLIIGENAFAGCSAMQTITLGENITEIATGAFANMTGLCEINYGIKTTNLSTPKISDASLQNDLSLVFAGSGASAGLALNFAGNVEFVPANMLSGNLKLQSIAFENGCNIKTIGNDAFSGCANLTDVNFENLTKIINIQENAFKGTKIETLTLYNNSNDINLYDLSFANIPGLREIHFNSNVNIIGNPFAGSCANLTVTGAVPAGAFEGNTLIATLTLPNDVTSVGEDAFSGCSGVRMLRYDAGEAVDLRDIVTAVGDEEFGLRVEFGASIVSIESGSFENNTKLVGISFANSEGFETNNKLETIESLAFSGCINLEEINFANLTSLQTIGDNAFMNCSKIAGHINIPDCVKTIGSSAFSGCSGATNLTIGKGVTTIGTSAFANMSALSAIHYNVTSNTAITDLSGRFTNSGAASGLSLLIGSNVSVVPANMFSGNTSLKGITFGGSEKAIGDFAFSGCTALASIKTNNGASGTLPTGLESIGESAFSGCTNLTVITIADSTTHLQIAQNAFKDCSGVINLAIGKGVASIGANAFSGMGALKNITYNIPNISDLTGVFAGAGANSTGISLMVGSEVEKVPSNMFKNNTKLKSVTLGSSKLVEIGDFAFAKCSGLVGIALPVSLRIIGEGALSQTGISKIEIPNDLNLLKDSAFEGNAALKTIKFGTGVASVNANVFRNCNPTLTISGGKVPAGVFTGDSVITTLTIGTGVTSIGEGAFAGMGELAVLNYNATTPLLGTPKTSDANLKNDLSGVFAGSGKNLILNIGDGVTSIPANMFSVNANLNTIKFGSTTAATIYANAFSGCSNLSKVEFNSSNVTIATGGEITNTTATLTVGGNVPAGAFAGNQDITELIITGDQARIGANAFNGCSHLSKIRFECANITVENGAFTDIYTTVICYGTKIPANAFKGNTSLQSVCIAGFEEIDDSAFEGCTSLSELLYPSGGTHVAGTALPSTLTKIGKKAFLNCTSISVVTIEEYHSSYSPKMSVGAQAFQGCTAVEYLTLGSKVNSIGAQAFADMTALKEIVFNQDVSELATTVFSGSAASDDGLTVSGNIPANAFNGNTSIKKLIILSNTTKVGQNAFKSSSATKLVIENGVQAIDSGAFALMHNLSEIEYNNGMIISDLTGRFEGSGAMSSFRVTFTAPVSSVPKGMFINNSNLTEVVFAGDNIRDIGAQAFSGCSKLATLDLSGQTRLEDIYMDAFSGTALSSITIPSSVDNIGENAFSDMTKLTEINYNASTNNIINLKNRFARSGMTGLKLNVGEDVIGIPANMFSGNTELESIVFMSDENLTKIGESAFSGCTKLSEIKVGTDGILGSIPSSVVEIGRDAFKNTMIESIIIPNGITEICEGTFENCGSLTNVALPSGLKIVGANAFKDCGNAEIVLPESVEEIGESAFAGTKINSVVLGGDILIGANAFANCPNLETITWNSSNSNLTANQHFAGTGSAVATGQEIIFGSAVTGIPDNFYSGATNLYKVTFSGSVLTSIGNSAFAGCTKLEEVKTGSESKLPDTVQSIGSDAFKNTTSLAQLDLNIASLETIGAGAFENSAISGTLIIPAETTQIGSNAFKSTQISIINISDGQPLHIGAGAFANCQLESVTFGNQREIIFEDDTVFAGVSASPSGLSVFGNIPSGAFKGNTTIQKLSIGGEGVAVGNEAFSGCVNLTELEIGSGVTAVGEGAFAGLTSLAKVDFKATNAQYALSGGTVFSAASTTLEVSGNIPRNAFNGNSNITTLTITNEVEEIGEGAFAGMSALQTINYNVSVQTLRTPKQSNPDETNNLLGVFASSGATGLKFSVDSYVKTIPANIFTTNTKLRTIEFKQRGSIIKLSNLKTIGANAFYLCSSVIEITLPSNLTTIGQGAFAHMTSLSVINYDVVAKGEQLFTPKNDYPDQTNDFSGVFAGSGRNNLVLSIGSWVEALPNEMFSYNSNLHIVSSSSAMLKTIGQNAFKGCTNLFMVNLEFKGASTIGANAFDGCTNLNEVNIQGNNSLIVENGAFANCDKVTCEINLKAINIDLKNSVFASTAARIVTIDASRLIIQQDGGKGVSFAGAQIAQLKIIGLFDDQSINYNYSGQPIDQCVFYTGNNKLTSITLSEMQSTSGADINRYMLSGTLGVAGAYAISEGDLDEDGNRVFDNGQWYYDVKIEWWSFLSTSNVYDITATGLGINYTTNIAGKDVFNQWGETDETATDSNRHPTITRSTGWSSSNQFVVDVVATKNNIISGECPLLGYMPNDGVSAEKNVSDKLENYRYNKPGGGWANHWAHEYYYAYVWQKPENGQSTSIKLYLDLGYNGEIILTRTGTSISEDGNRTGA